MSNPYTDEFGYPLTAGEALHRMNSRKQMLTGATKGGVLGVIPVSVHALAEDMAAADNDNHHEEEQSTCSSCST